MAERGLVGRVDAEDLGVDRALRVTESDKGEPRLSVPAAAAAAARVSDEVAGVRGRGVMWSLCSGRRHHI